MKNIKIIVNDTIKCFNDIDDAIGYLEDLDFLDDYNERKDLHKIMKKLNTVELINNKMFKGKTLKEYQKENFVIISKEDIKNL